MAKTWKKTSIKVASKDANETARNVEKLTGDSVSSTTVTVVDEIAK